MLSPTFVLWEIGYPLYTYGSIIIIALIIWQAKKNRQKLKLGSNRSHCRHQRRVKQRVKDRTSRARRLSRKEAEKPWELLAVMKSQGWFPQEGSVRRLLCADPSCPICNAVALEIKQWLASENTPVSPSSSGPSQDSSCLEILPKSSLSFDQRQGSQHNKKLSLPSATPSVSQLMNQKSLTQSAAQSTGTVSIQDYWADHQLKQGYQAPDVSWDAGALSSSSLEENRIPVNQQDKKKSNTQSLWEKQETAEAGLENKRKHVPHWINPKVKGEGHKESVLLSKEETLVKTTAQKVEKSPPSTKGPVRLAKLEKTTEDKGITFFDAHQCLDNEVQQHRFQPRRSSFQCFSHNSPKHCPQSTGATQLKISTLASAGGTGLYKENTHSRKKEFQVSQTSASP
ncbi:protein FAM205C [Phyllostomus hastatus]|uniref:protein FAM205C n=1 Tax=Phyllostomus hastatus TaxID=9423 RepID=UPI001E67E456|nr:protein FAM205C [Phyllostomus hastatus]